MKPFASDFQGGELLFDGGHAPSVGRLAGKPGLSPFGLEFALERVDAIEKGLLAGGIRRAEQRGPLEHHVLQQVGETGLPWELVHAADLEANIRGEGGGFPSLDDQEPHPVLERMLGDRQPGGFRQDLRGDDLAEGQEHRDQADERDESSHGGPTSFNETLTIQFSTLTVRNRRGQIAGVSDGSSRSQWLQISLGCIAWVSGQVRRISAGRFGDGNRLREMAQTGESVGTFSFVRRHLSYFLRLT